MEQHAAAEIDVALLDTHRGMASAANGPLRPECGATVTFVGSARTSSAVRPDGAVMRLQYEAYEPMALREMREIATAAAGRWGLHAVLLLHRIGIVEIGEEAILVRCDAPHRAEAFEACRWIVEEVKRRVPIWKREIFNDGTIWVEQHP